MFQGSRALFQGWGPSGYVVNIIEFLMHYFLNDIRLYIYASSKQINCMTGMSEGAFAKILKFMVRGFGKRAWL